MSYAKYPFRQGSFVETDSSHPALDAGSKILYFNGLPFSPVWAPRPTGMTDEGKFPILHNSFKFLLYLDVMDHSMTDYTTIPNPQLNWGSNHSEERLL